MKNLTLLLSGLSTLLFAVNLQAEKPDYSSFRTIFAPLPKVAESATNACTPDKIALGKRLFNDKRFSLDQDLSCNSCHNLATFGVDNEPTSKGHKAQRGGRNSPSVYNAALHLSQFWDGRAADVEAQALGPVLNPIEMAMPSDAEVVKRIKSDPTYIEQFKKAFPGEADPVTFTNFGKAIGAFERTLTTPSRFDAFLQGDDKALKAEEIAGMTTFRDVGCVACHNGVTVGGQMYQKLGMIKAFPTKDMGRFDVTKLDTDRFFFKVPSLRNIAKTGPYFHDGGVKTLEEAVRLMGVHQLGRDLSDQQIKEIVTFLNTLTGEITNQ